MMTEQIPKTNLTPRLAEIVRKIKDLQSLSRKTNFKTDRTQGELLSRLNADDLILVSRALQE